MLRGKTLPARLVPAHAAFEQQATRVESARRALLSCLPVGRVNPAPVPVGLDLLRDELHAVRAQLTRWRVPQMSGEWEGCRAAIEESLEAMLTAHRVAQSSTELEELLGAVGDVIEPLDAWADAERAWRGLRVRAARVRPAEG